MVKEINISTEELSLALGYLNKINNPNIKTDTLSFSFDETTGKIVNSEGVAVTGKELMEKIAQTAANNKSNVFVLDTDHPVTRQTDLFLENLDKFKQAGFKNFLVEYPEDRTVKKFGYDTKTDFNDMKLEILSSKKEAFIEEITPMFEETARGTFRTKAQSFFGSDKKAQKKVAKDMANQTYMTFENALKNDLKTLFFEPNREYLDKNSEVDKKINILNDIAYSPFRKDAIQNQDFNRYVKRVYDNLRNQRNIEQLNSAEGQTIGIIGGGHFETSNDVDEGVKGKSIIVATYTAVSELEEEIKKSINDIESDNKVLTKEKFAEKFKEKFGFDVPENFKKEKKYSLPDYIYTSGKEREKDELYNAAAYIKTNDDLLKYLTKNKNMLDEKSVKIIDEITAEKAQEKEKEQKGRQ